MDLAASDMDLASDTESELAEQLQAKEAQRRAEILERLALLQDDTVVVEQDAAARDEQSDDNVDDCTRDSQCPIAHVVAHSADAALALRVQPLPLGVDLAPSLPLHSLLWDDENREALCAAYNTHCDVPAGALEVRASRMVPSKVGEPNQLGIFAVAALPAGTKIPYSFNMIDKGAARAHPSHARTVRNTDMVLDGFPIACLYTRYIARTPRALRLLRQIPAANFHPRMADTGRSPKVLELFDNSPVGMMINSPVGTSKSANVKSEHFKSGPALHHGEVPYYITTRFIRPGEELCALYGNQEERSFFSTPESGSIESDSPDSESDCSADEWHASASARELFSRSESGASAAGPAAEGAAAAASPDASSSAATQSLPSRASSSGSFSSVSSQASRRRDALVHPKKQQARHGARSASSDDEEGQDDSADDSVRSYRCCRQQCSSFPCYNADWIVQLRSELRLLAVTTEQSIAPSWY